MTKDNQAEKNPASWKTNMDSYKGGSAPPAELIGGGLIAGMVGNLLTYHFLPAQQDNSVALSLLFQSMALPALLFFNETHQCVQFRQTLSPKASFSPAAAEAEGLVPFAIVESNRIHRNQMESFAYFFTSALSLASFCSEDSFYDARLMPAMVLNYTIGRFLYRFGYRSLNPHQRLFGMAYSMVVCVPGIFYGMYKFATEVVLAS